MNILPFAHFFGFLAYLYLAIFILSRNPRSLLNRVSFGFILCLCVWSFGAIFLHAPDVSKNTVRLFVNINSLGWCGLSSFFVWFSLVFTKSERVLQRRITYLFLFLLPPLFVYKQWTNALIVDFRRQPYGWASVWSQSIWPYLLEFYYVSFMLLGLVLIYRFNRKTESSIRKKQSRIILVTCMVSLPIASLMSDILPRQGIYVIPELADLTGLIWALGIVYAIVKYKFLTITPATAAENIISTMMDPLILLDHQYRIVSMNQAGLDSLGYEKHELEGKSVDILLAAQGTRTSPLARILGQETAKNYDLRLRTKEGGELPVVLSTSLLKDEEGNTVGAVCVAKDITELKKAEEEIRESERRYRTLVETAPDIIFSLFSEEGTISSMNPAFETITDWSCDELLGRQFVKIVHPDDVPIAVEKFEQALRGETTPAHELRILSKSGQYLVGELIATPEIRNGEVVNVIGFGRDVTERKRAEDQVRASLREKEVLLKEIHHRVKNNLQVMSSLLYLQSKNIKDIETLEMFQDSQSRVRSMALVHEKLYQSQDLARIDFAEYVRSLASYLFRSYGVNTNVIRLKINVDDVFLGVDAAIPCGLIVNELVSNSLKHAFPGGRRGEIRIEFYSEDDGQYALMVSDDGVGFPEDLDFRDTGSLGLQLVHTLIEQVGGIIELDRSDGTKFKITFTGLK